MDSLQITFFQASRSDKLQPGWVHRKTVPYIVIAQPECGEYEVSCSGRTARLTKNQAFLTPPNEPLCIVHHADRRNRFSSRWVHFSCVLHQTIDLGDLFEMPLSIPICPDLRDIMDRIHGLPIDVADVAGQMELRWRTVRLVCQVSRLKPEAEALLRAGRQLEPLLHHLRNHIAQDVSAASMARFVGMSSSRFFALFRERLNSGPMAYLKRLRLEAAAAQLLSSDAPIKQIAADTGFANPFHLSREFRRRYGASPKEFRSLNRQMSFQS